MNVNNNNIEDKSSIRACGAHSRRIRSRNLKRVASVSVACVMSTSGFAPPGVAAFQGPMTLSTKVTKANHQISRSQVRSLRRNPTELCYRDDPDYKSSQVHSVNNHITNETKEQLISNSTPTSAPPASNQLSNVFHTWWTAAKTRRAHQSAKEYALEQKRKQSVDLDAYLESIDKRYKRLHEREHKTSRAQQQQQAQKEGYTNALSWLLASEESSSKARALEQRRQEDGIYVLGLAGLASDRLLQKHQLPKPKRESKYVDSGVIDTKSQNVLPSATTKNVSSPRPMKTSPLQIFSSITKMGLIVQVICTFKHMQTSFEQCTRVLSDQSKNILLQSLRSSRKVLVKTPATINSIIGGRWAKSFVLAFLSAIFFVGANYRARPFTKA